MVSCRKVNAPVMSDMAGEAVVCRVELSDVEFLVRVGGSTYRRAQLQCAEVAYAGVQVRYTESRVGQRAVVKVVKWRWALAEVCSVPAAE